MSDLLKQAMEHWKFVAPLTSKPADAAEYKERVEALDFLLSASQGKEDHLYTGLIKLVADAIESHDAENYGAEPVSSGQMLSFLMDQHGLKAVDLPEIGSSNLVSEILNGEIELNHAQIEALSKRFHVTTATFEEGRPSSPKHRIKQGKIKTSSLDVVEAAKAGDAIFEHFCKTGNLDAFIKKT